MIQDVDESLCRLLAGELIKIPGCTIRHPEQITFDSPAAAESILDGEAHVNLYLRDVRENMGRREEGFYRVQQRPEKIVGIRRPPVHMDLSYLITVYAGDDPAAEHRLLADVLSVFLRCLAVPAEYLAGTLAGKGPNALPIEVALPEHSASVDLPGLWQALGSKMRPALSLLISCPFDPFETKWTIAVREAVLGMGQGTSSRGPQRPLDLSEVRVSAAGIVLRQDTEAPLAGVSISIEGYPEPVETDTEGFFRILNLTPGTHHLKFEKYGYHLHETEVVAPPTGSSGQVEPSVIALLPLDDARRESAFAARESAARNAVELVEAERVYHVSLTGTLRYPDGRPAAYIPVRTGEQRTVTDGDGVYCFFELPPGDHKVIPEVPLTEEPGEVST